MDVPPHGLSLGDSDVGAVSLRRNGELFGRAMVVCTINDASFKGLQCAMTLVLRKGQITVQGGGLDRKLPHAPSPRNADVFAVTGGTGIYAGANGTLTIRHGPRRLHHRNAPLVSHRSVLCWHPPARWLAI